MKSAELSRGLAVAIYATAMAWMEAAVVFYLRTHVDRIIPYQTNPLPNFEELGIAELIREFSTLVMIFAVGFLAGKSWRGRFGYMGIAFGIWDIGYYFFLRIMSGWPASIFDWDILFLLPLPWWGPVWAPVGIALMMILWGACAVGLQSAQHRAGFEWASMATGSVGILIALYVFMADAIRIASEGEEALRRMLPEHFNTPLFAVALALIAVPVFSAGRAWRKVEGV